MVQILAQAKAVSGCQFVLTACDSYMVFGIQSVNWCKADLAIGHCDS